MNYDCRPVRENYGAHLVILALFAASGVSFAFSGMMGQPVLWQALGLIFLLPAIQLIARYIVARYLYRLHANEDGSAELEIFVYRGGAKMQLLFHASMQEITAIAPLSRENARAKGRKRHNFAQDLCPRKALLLTVKGRGGECEVLFCPDEGMERLLRERAAISEK